MPYTAEISRSNPSCLLFLIDRSGSMEDPFGAGDGKSKADGVADAINRLLQNLVIKCAKSEGVRDYYHVGVIGYGGSTVGPAFGGELAGRDLVPISELAEKPERIEERSRKMDDGAGGLVEQSVKFPVWFDAVARGGTPMCEALSQAERLVSGWTAQHPDSFPPIVINITDGESTDGNPTGAADRIRSLQSADGSPLLFNLHLSSQRAAPVEFPSEESGLPDQHARLLFGMSSPLPDHIRDAARQDGYSVGDGARGFVFNADMVSVIRFLDIGTRPANLR
ncbi:MAG TPA: vWA domain-containing protein [Chloroflexota bacterium]|nr:vWA domain-containing protein [Chloroflexota bacterium]